MRSTMAGLTKLFPEGGSAGAGRAAVEAVKAGNDVLLIPSDLDGSYNGLLQAVRSGEIPESRIDESVLKILRAKASVGLNRATQVDINAVNRIVAKPASLATAEEIADEAVTLVRDNHQVLPLKAAATGTNSGQNAYQSTAENRAIGPPADFYRRQAFRCRAGAGASGEDANSEREDHIYRSPQCRGMDAAGYGRGRTGGNSDCRGVP